MATVQEKAELTVQQIDALADAIDDIAAAMARIRSGKLNDRALLLLISDASGVPKGDVQRVIDGMAEIKFRFRRRNSKGEYL